MIVGFDDIANHFPERLSLEGAKPVELSALKDIWIVISGHVDIFAAEPRQAGESGEVLHHLLRVDEAELVIGMGAFDKASQASGVRLFCKGSLGSEVIPICFDDFHTAIQRRSLLDIFSGDTTELMNLAGQKRREHFLRRGLEHWATALDAKMQFNLPIREPKLLESGTETRFEHRAGCLPEDRIAWFRIEAGAGCRLVQPTVSISKEAGFLPVTRRSTFIVEPETTVRCVDTCGWIQEDKKLLGLHHLALCFSLWTERYLKAQTAAEASRIEAAEDLTQTVFGQSLTRLSHIVTKRKRGGPDFELSNDPVYAACEVVTQTPRTSSAWKAERDEHPSATSKILRFARYENFQLRDVELKGNWWKNAEGSLLCATAEGDVIALLHKRTGHYVAHNLKTGEQFAVTSHTASKLSTMGWQLHPGLPARALSIRDILGFSMAGSRRDITQIILLGLFGGLLSLLVPILTGVIFDYVIPTARVGDLVLIASLLIVSTVSMTLFDWCRNLMVLRMEARVRTKVQAALWDRVLGLPMKFFREYSGGDLGDRMGAFDRIRTILSQAVISSILSSLFSFGNFVVLFFYDVQLALWATLLAAISTGVALFAAVVQLRFERQIAAIRGKLYGKLLEFVEGVSKLRLAGAEARAFNQWSGPFSAQQRLEFRSNNIQNNLGVFGGFFPTVSLMVLYFFAMDSVERGLTTGQFLAFAAAFSIFLDSLLSLAQSLLTALEVVPQYERAKPILDTIPEVDAARLVPSELEGDIKVENAHYQYDPSGPVILKGIDIEIKRGEFVAFVGPSGSGKSTLLKLLLGFEAPTQGNVLYDGTDLSHLDVREVRRQLGVVLQHGALMPGSIFENIRGHTQLTVEEAWDVARQVALAEDIEAMPMGMHTVLSAGGGLSGGQTQRLLIARSIAHKPNIVLLDEATSALDNQTQRQVMATLEHMKMTRVVVAHRLSTIRNADTIYVMQDGNIIESGTYESLYQEGGVFAQLAKRQIA